MTDPPHPSKRRRLDAAATLSKPFKSPLRRPAATNTPSTPDTTKAPPKDPADTSSIPSSTSPGPTSSPNLPLSATRARKPASTSTFSPRSPLADPEILVLQKQQRALQSRIAALRSEVDNSRQALRIESSTRDAELEALIIKWRVVSQDAADEVFVGARERVARMGGMAAWRERAKRDTFQRDDEMGNQGNADEEETDYPKVGPPKGTSAARQTEEEKKENEEFTMEFMLKTLNIEPVTIGFDTAAQKWSRD